MPIITLDKVKTLNQITVNTFDNLITELIPIAQGKIVAYCGTVFNSNSISLVDSFIFSKADKTIISNELFDDYHFYVGDIYISGSYKNDGFKQIESIEGNIVTLKSTETLEDEDVDTNSAIISQVVFPSGIEIPTATLINYLITKQGKLVESESLPGGYSVKYKDSNSLMKDLFKDYRKISL